ncbi:hypothetical protein MMC13_005964 [Lambiella insularis]|nr:hypothetical protein [Lambiella insularis]
MNNRQTSGQGCLDILTHWQVLGPFQIGTREATWGADPLDRLGGFPNLLYDETTTYDSSLGTNGNVGWSQLEIEAPKKDERSVEATLDFDFADIDWTFLQSIYGWAAFQFQAWTRGTILIEATETQTVVLYLDNVLEFYIDREPFFGGDLYAYRRAPLVLKLSPGHHTIDVRLTRDVRAMGGVGIPKLQIKIRVELSTSLGSLAVMRDKVVLPDMVGNRLVSRLGSIPIRNDNEEWIEILGLESPEGARVSTCSALKGGAEIQQETPGVSFLASQHRSVAPGQSRSIAFRIADFDHVNPSIPLRLKYQIRGSCNKNSVTVSPVVSQRASNEPHRMTFLHPSGVVSYAILTPPTLRDSNILHGKTVPVLLNLHGAGLEADSEQVRHMLDAVDGVEAWTVFPTGVTSWSGDDWHTWGFADVVAAVAAIPQWIEATGWNGPGVALDQWYVCGHSNGGQGTWFILSHQPDRVMAAAPVSGYSSIQAYVPYQFWAEMDPRITALLQGSLVSYRHELFTDNFVGIPISQQHGSNDDNVPVYHSRRLKQLIGESGWSSNYTELPGKGHWFDEVMTTEPMRAFYENISSVEAVKPMLPQRFSFVVPNSGDMGARGGIVVDQLENPDQLGRIAVVRSQKTSKWALTTSNIHRFHFSRPGGGVQLPQTIEIDRCLLSEMTAAGTQSFVRSSDNIWLVTHADDWKDISQRHEAQRGALDAILRTSGALIIHSEDEKTFAVANQIARNLYQYLAADCPIVTSHNILDYPKGNVISIFRGLNVVPRTLPSFPVIVNMDRGIFIRDAHGRQHNYAQVQNLGIIYLQPLPDARLQLVVWGSDDRALRYAARLVPMLTGVGQADFIVVNADSSWQGAAGVLAMGFFDHSWNVTSGSYLT